MAHWQAVRAPRCNTTVGTIFDACCAARHWSLNSNCDACCGFCPCLLSGQVVTDLPLPQGQSLTQMLLLPGRTTSPSATNATSTLSGRNQAPAQTCRASCVGGRMSSAPRARPTSWMCTATRLARGMMRKLHSLDPEWTALFGLSPTEVLKRKGGVVILKKRRSYTAQQCWPWIVQSVVGLSF